MKYLFLCLFFAFKNLLQKPQTKNVQPFFYSIFFFFCFHFPACCLLSLGSLSQSLNLPLNLSISLSLSLSLSLSPPAYLSAVIWWKQISRVH